MIATNFNKINIMEHLAGAMGRLLFLVRDMP